MEKVGFVLIFMESGQIAVRKSTVSNITIEIS
jgi:hypothetical protein